MTPRPLPRDAAARLFATGLAACLAFAAVRARAADLQMTLPTLTVPPGATVLLPLVTSAGPAGFGIQSVEFRIDFAPGIVSASASHPDGWVQSWGAPFVNANASFIAVAAAGFPATASSGTLLNTLELTVSPAAPPGTDMPLAFHHLLFNEGAPSVEVTPGLLRVRTTAAVEPGAGAGLALSSASPNPAADATRFVLTVPAGGSPPVRLAVYGIDGRLVRELANARLSPGRHEFRWDTRDAAGARVPPGLYFARAASGAGRTERRVVVSR